MHEVSKSVGLSTHIVRNGRKTTQAKFDCDMFKNDCPLSPQRYRKLEKIEHFAVIL